MLAISVRGALVRPLSALAASCRRITEGHFDERIVARGPRDVRDMASDVEDMRQRIVEELEASRAARAQLDEQTVELRRSNAELEQFAYVASHDLQEPLRKILVFSDKIQTKFKNTLDDEMVRNLDKIVKASERMQLLISDLLRFSRGTGSHEDYTLLDLNALIADVVQDMEVDIERTEALVRVDALPKMNGIASQMRQLFQNLISNSIKFRQKDISPIVHVYTDPQVRKEQGNGSRRYFRLVIEDNGIGFEQKFASEIFVVFKRLHSYHEFEGSGVGLSICKKIVERHSGYISAESTPGHGARFYLDLPLVETESQVQFSDPRLASQLPG